MTEQQEQKVLELVLCPSCATEICDGDTVIFSSCLLCACRSYRKQVRELEAERDEITRALLESGVVLGEDIPTAIRRLTRRERAAPTEQP